MGVGWRESDDRNPTLPSITSIRCNIIDAAWWMYLLVASSPLPPPCFPLPNSILPDRNGSMKFPPRFQDSLSFTIIRNPSIFYQSKFCVDESASSIRNVQSDLWDGISSRSIVKGEGRDSSLCFSYSFLPLSLPFFFSPRPIQQTRTRYAKRITMAPLSSPRIITNRDGNGVSISWSFCPSISTVNHF